MKLILKASLALSLLAIIGCNEQDFGKIPNQNAAPSSGVAAILDTTELGSCDPLVDDVNCPPNPDPTPSPTDSAGSSSGGTESGSSSGVGSSSGGSSSSGAGSSSSGGSSSSSSGGGTCTNDTDQIHVFVSSVVLKKHPSGQTQTFTVNRVIDLAKLAKNAIAELSIPVAAGTSIKEIVLNVPSKKAEDAWAGCTQVCPRGIKIPPGKIMLHFHGSYLTYNSAKKLKISLLRLEKHLGEHTCMINPSYELEDKDD